MVNVVRVQDFPSVLIGFGKHRKAQKTSKKRNRELEIGSGHCVQRLIVRKASKSEKWI